MLKVTKFGGSSQCDRAGFSRVREIVLADPARRVVVVSAAGRRPAADHKITDILYLCHAHLQYGVSCWDLWRRIADRYREIRDGCCLTLPIEAELDAIYAAMRRDTPQDWIVSRGEYLSARLMADLLGFEFVDAKDWLLFDAAGRVRQAASYAALGSLADGRKIVTPGFYGALPDGAVHTLPRGGSDVTGALAAAALHADLYENWTDVAGVLAADPRLIQNPAPGGQLRYEELQTLSRVGMQILHEDAVAPVRQAQIPLRICNAFEPEKPGTLVRPQVEPDGGQICFAGRRKLAMLRLSCPQEPDAETKLADVLEQARLSPFSMQSVCGELTALVPMEPGSERLRRLREQAAQALRPQSAARPLLCRSCSARSKRAARQSTCCKNAVPAPSCSSTTANMSSPCAPPTPPAAICTIDKRKADMIEYTAVRAVLTAATQSAPVVELADTMDLGDVTSVKVFLAYNHIT